MKEPVFLELGAGLVEAFCFPDIEALKPAVVFGLMEASLPTHD